MAVVRELITELRYKLNEAGLKEYSRKAKQAGEEVAASGKKAGQVWNQSAQEAAKGLNVLQKRAGALLATYLSFRGARSFLNLVGELDQAKARLRATGLEGEKFAQVHERLGKISQNYTGELEDNIEGFAKFSRVLDGTGISVDTQLNAFEALSAGVAASGGSVSAAERIQRRMARSLVDGSLSASTLQTMIDANYIGFQQFSKALQELNPELDASEENLRKLAKEGKLTTDIVLPALERSLAGVKDEAGKIPSTIEDAMKSLRSRFKTLVSDNEQASKSLELVVKAINWVTDNLETLMTVAAGLGAAFGLAKIISAITTISKGLAAAKGAMVALGAATGLSLGPLLAIVAAVILLGLLIEDAIVWLQGGESVLGDIIGNVEDWKHKLDPIVATVKDIWKNAVELGKAFFYVVTFIPRMVLQFLKFIGAFDFLKKVAKSVFALFLDELQYFLDKFNSTIKLITSLLKGDFKAAFAILKDMFIGFINNIINRINFLIDKANKIPGVNIGTIGQISTSSMQSSGRAPVAGPTTTQTDNSNTTINVVTNSDNPAAIGNAVERASRRGRPGLPPVEASA